MIDVIIPAYNCTGTIARTLGSLVAQTDSYFKVTIVDDHSTDNLAQAIAPFLGLLDLRVIRNAKNLGCGMSRQVGIDNTTASHYCFLDSDDMLMPYAVETFNACIRANPDLALLHSYFYQQTVTPDGDPAVVIKKDGYTWCHGKLYNRAAVQALGIRNSPAVRWADDSYFNAMCMELLPIQLMALPMYYWTDNPASVMHKPDSIRDAQKKQDFLQAMVMAAEFVHNKKGSVSFVGPTLARIQCDTADERRLYNRLKDFLEV